MAATIQDSRFAQLKRLSRARPRRRLAPWVIGLIDISSNFGARLIIIPLNRLVELTICREHYARHDPSYIGPSGDVPELYCKEKPIQAKLAYLIGLITFLGLGLEGLVTIPLGYVSDRYGRKVVLILNQIGVILAFSWVMLVGYAYTALPVEAIIAAPFFYLLGGNVNVATANMRAVITDVSYDAAQRTMIFSYLHAIGKINLLLNPVIASFTLRQSIWLPFWIGIGSLACGFVAITALPETRSNASDQLQRRDSMIEGLSDATEEHRPLFEGDAHSEYGSIKSSTQPVERQQVGFREHIRRGAIQIQVQWTAFLHLLRFSRNSSLIFNIFFLLATSGSTGNILLQYISNRYHWTFAKTGYLFTVKAGAGLFLYTILVPLGIYISTNWGQRSKAQANLQGAKISIVLVTIGTLAIGLSPRIWILIIALVVHALGMGTSMFMLSLLASATFDTLDDTYTARIFSIVGLLETCGELVGTGIISGIWIKAVKIGGAGLGLPFLAAALSYLAAGVSVWLLNF